MAIENHVGMRVIQQLPERLGIGAGAPAGTETGGYASTPGCTCSDWRQVGLQPFILCRSGTAPACLGTIRIQGDQVPGSNIKTVITLANRSGCRSKILKVTRRARIGRCTTRAAAG